MTKPDRGFSIKRQEKRAIASVRASADSVVINASTSTVSEPLPGTKQRTAIALAGETDMYRRRYQSQRTEPLNRRAWLMKLFGRVSAKRHQVEPATCALTIKGLSGPETLIQKHDSS